MAGERLMAAAVVSLADCIRDNIAASLRAIETEQGLAPNSIADPVDIYEANVETDLRTPLVEVFDDSGECTDYRNNEWQVLCMVVLSFVGDADIALNERMMRRYLTALVDSIRAHAEPNADGCVFVISDYSAKTLRGPNSPTRYVCSVNVHVTRKD